MAHTSNNTVKKLGWVGRFCLGIFRKGENVSSGAKGLGRDGNEQLEIDITQNRVWVSINRVTVGYSKESFIAVIRQSESFKEAVELGVKTF